ncbi:MAG: hypothetical protein A2V66_01965 [Ignavibacteria bacterium RBG_13_36_8]|nr:MAG: hypothetical protein A2V66_01965 [Ignavibacteria bacterium RBG_13_36_8]
MKSLQKKLPACFAATIFFIVINICAQKSGLYMPLNIHWAYENGIRSMDGKPGPNYWINKSNYNISVELIPAQKKIVGSESIVYFNNSPDSLRIIVIRLYQDFYRRGNTRDWQLPPQALTDGVEIRKLVIAGEEISLDQNNNRVNRYGTNIFVSMEKSIPPSESVDLRIEWSFEIPSLVPIRTGAYSDSTFMIAYWYPQVAVYDDVSGWDTFDYKGTTEFYNDLNNYSVSITVPRGYVVWATGILQNPQEVFAEKYFKKYQEAYRSDKVVKIITAEDYINGMVTADNEKNIWVYKAEHVPDFAFAVANDYLWDGSSLVVDEQTGRRTFISAAYSKESKDFYEVAQIARTSIFKLSNEFPGIPFPYSELTVFNGRGGMEYPMMVNDGSMEDRSGTVHVTSHEITHSYFPFYMGTNERRYAWMDEGWAVMLPFDLQSEIEASYDPRVRFSQQYANYSGMELEVPPMVSSTLLTGNSYRTAAYNRSAMAYEFLRDYLGKEAFKKALKEFINRWNGKHPVPYDFFFTFNDVTGEDLSWYWKPWFFEFGYPDLGIKDVIVGDEKLEIIIEKKGNIPVPVEVKVTYEDGTVDSVHSSVGVWKNGNNETKLYFKSGKKPISVELGNPRIPDVISRNNYYYGGLE